MTGRRPVPWRVAAALSMLGLAAGCAGPRRPPAAPLPRDPAALAARRPPLAPFRAELKGRISGSGARGRFRAGLGAQPPDFRLDVFHPLSGSTLLSVGLRQGRLRAVWPDSGECLDGAAEADLLSRLVGLPVAPDEWLPLVTGHVWPDGPGVKLVGARHPPMAVAAGDGPAPAARDRLLVAVERPDGGARWEAELLAERQGLALRARRTTAQGEDLQAEYPRWRRPGPDGSPGGPQRIVLRAPSRGLRLELEVRAVAAGGPATEALLPPRPAGCREVTPAELEERLPFAAVREPPEGP